MWLKTREIELCELCDPKNQLKICANPVEKHNTQLAADDRRQLCVISFGLPDQNLSFKPNSTWRPVLLTAPPPCPEGPKLPPGLP